MIIRCCETNRIFVNKLQSVCRQKYLLHSRTLEIGNFQQSKSSVMHPVWVKITQRPYKSKFSIHASDPICDFGFSKNGNTFKTKKKAIPYFSSLSSLLR